MLQNEYGKKFLSNRKAISCCKTLIQISLSFISLLLVIWAIIADILLISRVYLYHDIKFFVIGTAFLSLGLLFLWLIGIFIVNNNYQNDKLSNTMKLILCIPILNAPFVLLYDDMRYTDMYGGILTALFQALISFPLYILDVSFILENRKLYMWNILQLISALFTLSMFPCLFAWKESAEHEQISTLTDRFKRCTKFSFLIVPMMPIEIIHFFPLLFEYYYYKNIDYHQFFIILLFFNLPKLLILTVRNMDYGTHLIQLMTQSYYLLAIPTLILPLLPWQWSIIYNFSGRSDNVIKCWYGPFNLVTMILYFGIAYGGMTYFLWDKNMGWITYYLIIYLAGNIILICIVDIVAMICARKCTAQ
eukprot:420205_1